MKVRHLYFKYICIIFYVSILFIGGCISKDIAGVKPDDLSKKDAVQQSQQLQGISITGITFEKLDNTSRVLVETAGGSITYTAFKLSDSSSLVIDIPDAVLDKVKEPISIENEFVSQISASQYGKDGASKIGRIMIGLKDGIDHKIDLLEGKLVVSLMRGDEKIEGKPAKEVKDTSTEKRQAADDNRVTAIDVKPSLAGTKVSITTSKKADYKVLESIDSKSIVIDLKGAVMPDEFKRVMDMSLLDVPITSVTSYELQDNKLARVMVKLKDKISYNVVQEGNNIYLNFPQAGIKPKVSAETKKVIKPLVLTEHPITDAAKHKQETKKVSQSDEPKPPASVDFKEGQKKEADAVLNDNKAEKGVEPKADASLLPKTAQTGQSQWTGKRISLDFKDADIGNVIRLIADVSQLNIILSDEVTGKVTLRLKDVPWDQAFDIILKSKGLGKIQEGNVIRVASLSKIKEEEKLEDLISDKVAVNYAVAKDMEEKVKSVLSGREGASVISDERTNTIIIRDIPVNVKKAVELLKGIDTQTPQVIIEARIVEASSSFAKELGVQWGMDVSYTGSGPRYAVGGATGTGGLAALGGTSGQSAQATSGIATNTGVRNVAVNLPIASPTGAIGFTFGKLGGTPFTLDLKLMAAESAGISKTISRPKIATINNKEATISQGKKIPYQTTSSSGTETKFIDATLKLKVVPHIIADGTILMKVDVTKNSKGEDTSAGPVILEKAAATEILLRDMETAVIGGIIETVESDSTSGVPWLKDLPVIGGLFKSKSKSDSQTELLIFITPAIQKEKL
ncbi:MAG: type IV pilus secretin PilQ [Deltaproteobacteria bacterium]|nr:type IV pilus secretin PilQ [Deltaproteobacteria bacterium]